MRGYNFRERQVGIWAGRSIHEITKRDVVEVLTAIEQRGAPVAANKALKATQTFLRWCVGRAVLDQSPAEGVPLPSKEVARDGVLDDNELARVILAARKIGGPYGGIVELLALTGQRREEVAGLQREELDLAQRIWMLPQITDEERQGPCRTPIQAVDGRAQTRTRRGPIFLFAAWNQSVSGIQSSEPPAGSDVMAPSRFASDLRVWDGAARGGPACRGQKP
jgi:integrase